MASADGVQKEPGGSQLAVAQHALDFFQQDGGEQEPDESQLALPDGTQVRGGGQEMPERFRIGTATAFEKEYAFVYEKNRINEETIYLCRMGSKWARPKEFLMLRLEEGTWTAYDSAFLADRENIQCRQGKHSIPLRKTSSIR